MLLVWSGLVWLCLARRGRERERGKRRWLLLLLFPSIETPGRLCFFDEGRGLIDT